MLQGNSGVVGISPSCIGFLDFRFWASQNDLGGHVRGAPGCRGIYGFVFGVKEVSGFGVVFIQGSF